MSDLDDNQKLDSIHFYKFIIVINSFFSRLHETLNEDVLITRSSCSWRVQRAIIYITLLILLSGPNQRTCVIIIILRYLYTKIQMDETGRLLYACTYIVWRKDVRFNYEIINIYGQWSCHACVHQTLKNY